MRLLIGPVLVYFKQLQPDEGAEPQVRACNVHRYSAVGQPMGLSF